MERRGKVFVILGILTLIGFIIRMYHLTYNSLWLDESATVWFSTLPSLQDITITIIRGETNPPAFYWLEFFVIRIAGSGEFALRIIPAVAGTLLIPVTYYIGDEVWDDLTGLVSAAFISFSPWIIFYSQEARAYTLTILLFGIGIFYWLRFIRNPDSPTEKTDMYCFPIFISLAFWFHFYAIFFTVFALLLALIIRKRKAVIPILITGIISLPPTIMLFLAMSAHTAPLRYAMFNTIGFNVFTDTINYFFGFNPVVSFFLLLLTILGFFYIYRDHDVTGNAILMLTLVPITVSGLLTILFFNRWTITTRYLGYMIPLLAVCIGVSIELASDFFKYLNIRKLKNPRMIFSIGLTILLIVANIPSYQIIYGYTKPQWKEASEYVQSIAQPGDYVAAIPSYTWQPIFYYYPKKTAVSNGIIYINPSYENLQHIASTKNSSSKIIFVISPSDHNYLECFNGMISWMEQNTETKEFYQLNVSVYSGSEIGFNC